MAAEGAGSLAEASGAMPQQAAGTFGLLASPARLHILQVPARGERHVTDIADVVGGAPPSLSRHLSVLRTDKPAIACQAALHVAALLIRTRP
ncbi:helix-turn-helix transcriptional regulator [Streptomyces sp. TLI_105]|uniref:ArsR/SmtB family transcription factor n=1 Tax=Streptomyces sp. TLI_105 TaxID=1881019 RepID=UPI00089494D6|nr:ArsR family transcriptional regulator [Streptomyces sp. TLI_105]SEC00990.1 regulatory protein, arsR family [Streptomyces sp. TLI_105]